MRSDLENSPRFFDPRTLARLKGLPLLARHIVEGYVAGLHRSPYRGFSIEFAEHREICSLGDDLRYVDWKVFGRTDKFYLKQFEDETNLLCHLLLDVSQSMTYRGPHSPLAKLEYAECVAVVLAWLCDTSKTQWGWRLSTIRWSGVEGCGLAAARIYWPQLLTVMEQAEPLWRTSLGKVLPELAARLTRRGVVVILSDLFDEPWVRAGGAAPFSSSAARRGALSCP